MEPRTRAFVTSAPGGKARAGGRPGRYAAALLVAVAALLPWQLGPSGAHASGECAPFTQETFPLGMVWWRADPKGGGALADVPAGQGSYLVTAVRPDGVLVQNREARYPRLLTWAVLARSQLSTDGRRTWQRGCRS